MVAFGARIESLSLRAFFPSTPNIPTAPNLCDGTRRVQGSKPFYRFPFKLALIQYVGEWPKPLR
jgi:hypothetical protein